MKRFLIIFIVLGVIAGSAAAAEAKNGPRRAQRRTVEGSYCNPFAVWPPVPVCGWNQIRVHTLESERFLTAKVADAHGQPLYVEVYEGAPSLFARIHQSLGGDPGETLVGSFCGETIEALSFPPGARLTLSIVTGVPPSSCPTGGFATTGSASVTLSNLP